MQLVHFLRKLSLFLMLLFTQKKKIPYTKHTSFRELLYNNNYRTITICPLEMYFLYIDKYFLIKSFIFYLFKNVKLKIYFLHDVSVAITINVMI